MFNVSRETQTSKYYVGLLLGDQSVLDSTFDTNTPKHSTYIAGNLKYHDAFHTVLVTPSLFKTLCGHHIKKKLLEALFLSTLT
jgi:hypothetical protein